MDESHQNGFFTFRRVDVHTTGHTVHPLLHWNAAGQTGVLFQVQRTVQQLFLIITVTISLLLNAIEPVILEDYSAGTTNGSSGIVIVRSVVGPVGVVVSIAKIGVLV